MAHVCGKRQDVLCFRLARCVVNCWNARALWCVDAFEGRRTMCDGRPYATRSRNRTRGPGLSGTLCALITLASCGGGSSTTTDSPPTAPAPTPVAASDAARLLEQATFGATASDIAHVQSIGIEAYIGEQLAYAPTQYTGFTYTPHTAPASCKNDGSNPPDAASLCARDQYSPTRRRHESTAVGFPLLR